MKKRWDLGYLGTYSLDRQPTLEKMLIEPARRWSGGRFSVTGALYPEDITWPRNVALTPHLAPAEHRKYYNQQRFTLNVTRADMIDAGYSPSVRLFEAAACGVPIISDYWNGLDELFVIGEEIIVARSAEEVLDLLRSSSAEFAYEIGRAARRRVLQQHSAAERARELETHLLECIERDASPRKIISA